MKAANGITSQPQLQYFAVEAATAVTTRRLQLGMTEG